MKVLVRSEWVRDRWSYALVLLEKQNSKEWRKKGEGKHRQPRGTPYYFNLNFRGIPLGTTLSNHPQVLSMFSLFCCFCSNAFLFVVRFLPGFVVCACVYVCVCSSCHWLASLWAYDTNFLLFMTPPRCSLWSSSPFLLHCVLLTHMHIHTYTHTQGNSMALVACCGVLHIKNLPGHTHIHAHKR